MTKTGLLVVAAALLAALPLRADDTPPTVPVIQEVISECYRHGPAAHLSWNASTDDESESPLYRVFRDGVFFYSTYFDDGYDESWLRSGEAHVYQVSAVDEAGNESARSAPTAITVGPCRQPVLGARRLAVLLLRFAERPDVPFDAAGAEARVFSDPDSIGAFIAEGSYGKASLSGRAHGWYVLPRTMEDYCQHVFTSGGQRVAAYCDDRLMKDDVESEVLRDVDFRGVDVVALVVHGLTEAYAAGDAAPLSGAPQLVLGTNRVPDAGHHELGHVFGLSHAGSWGRRGSVAIGPSLLDLWLGGSRPALYGDVASAMGNGFGHYNAYEKETLGWLGPGEVAVAGRDGEYLIAALETPSAGVKLLRLPLDGVGNEYFLEYRRPVGFDARLLPREGVIVHARLAFPVLEDAATITVGEFSPDVSLPLLGQGQVLTDPYRSLSFEVVETNAAHARVRVSGIDLELPDLMRADFAALAPLRPRLQDVFPFDPQNPLTPVIVRGLRSGEDPDAGILARRGTVLSLYSTTDVAPARTLYALKDVGLGWARLDVGPDILRDTVVLTYR